MNKAMRAWRSGGGFSEVLSRVDGNQGCISNDLQLLGCTVQDLSGVGHGCPDILVGFQSKNYVFEIKTNQGKLN